MSKKMRLIAPLLVAASALASSACVEPEGNFFVECMTEVEEEAAGTCDPGAAFYTYNPRPGVQEAFQVGVVVANRLREDPRVEQSTLQVQAKDILLTEVEVGIEALEGSVDPQVYPAVGIVPAATGSDPGRLTTAIPLPGQILDGLGAGQTAIINVRFYGRTTGGDELETPVYYMPIVVPSAP